MSRWVRRLTTTALVIATAVVATYHVGTMPPRPRNGEVETMPHSAFLTRTAKHPLNHLVVEGTSLERGVFAGHETQALLNAQEAELQRQLARAIPSALGRRVLALLLMRWFNGIDEYFNARELDEMSGVGQSASHDYDFLADGYTRQVAYHGIHEVGQLFVDVGGADMGCTVFAVPSNGGWTLGRNFDFEGGRIFDEEKLLKWVFPERGLAYLSVIWAGMVGAVTGVNESGVYISINAAGSTDFRRKGTPTTLVASRVLEAAKTAEEAVQILSDATTFITDIFIVADRRDAYRVEKSPKRTFVHHLTDPTVVANHLTDAGWTGDRINDLRKAKLTTLAREARGNALLAEFTSTRPAAPQVLALLRDKGRRGTTPLVLGHRSAIDALIATHSVVYDSSSDNIWVGAGPSVAGEFFGFDLAESFRQRTPVSIASMPADPEVSPDRYRAVKAMVHQVAEAERLLSRNDCAGAAKVLDPLQKGPQLSYGYWTARGDWHRCRHEMEAARVAWKSALELEPAYSWERSALEERLR